MFSGPSFLKFAPKHCFSKIEAFEGSHLKKLNGLGEEGFVAEAKNSCTFSEENLCVSSIMYALAKTVFGNSARFVEKSYFN